MRMSDWSSDGALPILIARQFRFWKEPAQSDTMQGMGKEWEGTIAKRGRAVFKETGRYSYVALLLLSGAAFGWLGTMLMLVGGSSYFVFGALALRSEDRRVGI